MTTFCLANKNIVAFAHTLEFEIQPISFDLFAEQLLPVTVLYSFTSFLGQLFLLLDSSGRQTQTLDSLRAKCT